MSSIDLVATPLKRSLLHETHIWKQAFGANLNRKAWEDMDFIFTFCADTTHTLTKNVRDLDDVRAAMDALKVCMCACVFACVSVCAYVCVCAHVCVSVCAHVCMCVRMCVCLCMRQ